jgi:general secretion pathway protein C
MDLGTNTIVSRLAAMNGSFRSIVEVIMVVILALVSSRLVWLIAYPSGAVADFVDRPLPAPIASTSGGLSVSVDRTIILQNNPFASDVEDEVIVTAPETSLNLQLDGLRMSNVADVAGNAIIRATNGQSENYQIGDEVIAGVTLERILSDRVIINRDGANETLMLGGRQAGLSVIGDESMVSSPVANLDQASATASAPDLPEIAGRIVGPEILFTSMRAEPARTERGATGYRLLARGDAALMRDAGFEPGDILLQFNNTSVTDTDLEELFDRFGQVQSATLLIERDGVDRIIRLSIG